MLPLKPLQIANFDVIVAAAAAAAVAAAFAAAVVELLLLLACARVRQGSVQNGVHVGASRVSMCTCMCTGLGHPGSARAVGAGQWVSGGLAEPSAGVRGPSGVARQQAWAVRAQRHPPFAVLFSVHSFHVLGRIAADTYMAHGDRTLK